MSATVHSFAPGPFRRILLLSVAFVLMVAVQAGAQVDNGVTLVKADLLADTTAIVPGKAFTVGVRLKMASHWHTYWQYSGDAGLPTTIKWDLPAGYQAGPIQWPLPEKIVSPGDIINYGYSDEVVLLTEIMPPAQIPADGHVTLKAKAMWLVCADKCVPGSADLSLKLPTGGNAQAANAEIFGKYRALLPLTTLPSGAKLEAVAGSDSLYHDSAFVFVAQPLNMDPASPEERTLDFYPVPDENTEVGHPEIIKRDPFFYEIRLPIVSEPKAAAHFDGVLVAGTGENRRGWFVRGASLWPKMATPAAASPAAASDTPPASAVVQTNPPSPGSPSSGPAAPAGSIWHFLLLGFLGGLILNVMPCVLPVISLKLFSFVKQANESPARVLRLGIAYAAGVFAWFLGFAALIVGLRAAGHEVGYAFHLQNSWFLVGLSAATFVFALNLLGVFEIILPGNVTNAAAGAAGSREGYAGAFIQGVLATVLGSACTAPVFGEALAFAFSQSALGIFAMFAAIAAGMSAPFVLLAARPGWLKFLPKPGVWMERVKQGTGFLLLATVLWLLYVLGRMKGSDGVVWTGAFLLVLGVACWVQGAFNTFTAGNGARWAARSVIAVFALGGGWLCAEQIAAAQLPVSPGGARSFAAQLDAALKTGRTVFVDFTADWCTVCKSNEKFVLSSDAVQKALRDDNIMYLTADYTTYSDDVARFLKRFNSATVPLYVIYPAGNPDAPVVLPTLLTQETVLHALADAKSDSPARKPLSLNEFSPH